MSSVIVNDDGGITLWGAPSTGKTTFLAALHVGLIQRHSPWLVRGVAKADSDALTRMTTELVQNRTFPDATVSIENYRWELVGTVQRTVRRGRLRRTQITETVAVPLDLIDASGESAHPIDAGPVRWEELIDSLERSRGIVFLFDPTREFDSGDAFVHTVGVVNELNQRMRDRNLPEGRLPHYVAICVAKFDEIKVLKTAENLNMIYYDNDDHGCPRVHEEEARAFFAYLCEVSDSGEAELVPNLLESSFRPERIKYFVTSAIGFYIDPNSGTYDRSDFQNHLPGSPGKEPSRIRGTVRPINVVEPILWLGQCLAEEAAR